MSLRIVNLALIAALTWSCGGSDGIAEKVCPKATCGDYLTQQAAQDRHDSDPACFKDLDPDGDGIACANLPSSGTGSGNGTGTGTGTGTGCPTTSACGCSGKKKDDCGGQCCKWTTGSGCGCK
jgi:hypothetical protein